MHRSIFFETRRRTKANVKKIWARVKLTHNQHHDRRCSSVSRLGESSRLFSTASSENSAIAHMHAHCSNQHAGPHLYYVGETRSGERRGCPPLMADTARQMAPAIYTMLSQRTLYICAMCARFNQLTWMYSLSTNYVAHAIPRDRCTHP